MMQTKIIDAVKHLWETWDIRALMVLSLIFQSFLTFLSPFRKRWRNGLFVFVMWLLYLSADAVALFTIGLISSNQMDSMGKHVSEHNSELLVFWAPFLLLHLGGPDTITALALEDNQLWHRHALQLVTQVVVTLYVFILSIVRHDDVLLPTVLIFVDGCIKYTERTCALYSACTEVIRDSLREPLPPNYDLMVEEYYSAEDAHIPSFFQVKYRPTTHRMQVEEDKRLSCDDDCGLRWYKVEETDEMVGYAYYFYTKSKGLLADAFSNIKDDGEIREYFLYKPPEEAFKILEIELNLIYDVLHTKVFLMDRKRGCLRIVSFLSVVGSLLLFYFKDKSNYQSIDVGITYVLLLGAIFLDATSIAMLVCSDWWIIIVHQKGLSKLLTTICSKLLLCSRLLRDTQRTRWSQSISSYNVFNFITQLKVFFINLLYVKTSKVEQPTLKFIFQQLQHKANLATDREAIEDVCSARGNLVMQEDYFLVSEYLLPWTLDVDFDESLLIWHLATDICYWAVDEDTREKDLHCRACKQLSDYMSYLLLCQQALLSQLVGNSEVRFEHTVSDIRELTKSFNVTEHQNTVESLSLSFSQHVLCKGTEEDNLALIGKTKDSQSVFHEACKLAKQLTMLGEKQWEIMSNVWVELLSYAAIHSSARSHLARLSKGAELITFVWLYMVHLGFTEPLQPSRGLRSTKLIIHK